MLNAKQLQQYRRRLEALVDRLAGEVGRLALESQHGTGGESSGGLSDLPLHLADLAAVEEGEHVTLGLLTNEELLLTDARAALDRMARGRFGQCEGCGKDIARPRLNALPYTRHCLACARRERHSGA